MRTMKESRAVPVLTNPYPAPSVIHTTCTKPESGRLGVHFKWDGRRSDRVKILDVAADSPLQGTDVKAGQVVLAVNGVAAITSKQTAQLIRESGSQVTLTTMNQHKTASVDTITHTTNETHPYCKLIAAPTWKDHPGITLDSTRGRCLVQISRVFKHGPFAGTELNEGDIILSINDIPISNIEDADRVIRLSAANNEPYLLLYVVDMIAYRHSIYEELKTVSTFQHIKLSQDLPKTSSSRNIGFVQEKRKGTIYVKSHCYAVEELLFDNETQHLIDTEPHKRMRTSNVLAEQRFSGMSRNTVRYKKVYGNTVLPFIKAFNDGIEKRMRSLEEIVCCEAWKHSVSNITNNNNHNNNMSSTSSFNSDQQQHSPEHDNGESCDDDNNYEQRFSQLMAILPTATVEEYPRPMPLPFAQAEIQILPVV